MEFELYSPQWLSERYRFLQFKMSFVVVADLGLETHPKDSFQNSLRRTIFKTKKVADLAVRL